MTCIIKVTLVQAHARVIDCSTYVVSPSRERSATPSVAQEWLCSAAAVRLVVTSDMLGGQCLHPSTHPYIW